VAGKGKSRTKRGLIVLLTLILISTLVNYYAYPGKQSVAVGQPINLQQSYPQSLAEYITISDGKLQKQTNENWYASNTTGEINFSLKLFGWIPLKQVNVEVIEPRYLYPGGQSVGILLRTQGVLIVGSSPVVSENAKKLNPAKDAGLEIGDVITKINGEEINDDEKLSVLINELGSKGEKILLSVKRGEKEKEITLEPIYCTESKKWRIGLLVRDNVGGIKACYKVESSSFVYIVVNPESSKVGVRPWDYPISPMWNGYSPWESIVAKEIEKLHFHHFEIEYTCFSEVLKTFCEEWIEKYSDEKSTDYQLIDDMSFPNYCKSFGWIIDQGKSFKNQYPCNSYEEALKHISQVTDIKLLGNLLFSYWRYFNHWAESSLTIHNRAWFIAVLTRLKELALTNEGGKR